MFYTNFNPDNHNKLNSSNQASLNNTLPSFNKFTPIKFDQELIEAIKSSDAIALVGHRMPDADCTASLIALKETLQQHLGKKVDLYLEDGYPINFTVFAGVNEIQESIPENAQYDSVIFLDTATRKRAGFGSEFQNMRTICIDHHEYTPVCDRYGDLKYVGGESSASEIMVSLVSTLGVAISDLSNDARALLLYGIEKDTGNFTSEKTSEQTKIIAKILRNSLPQDYYECKKHEVENYKKISELHNYAIDRMAISEDQRVVISTISQQEMKKLGVNTADCSFSKIIEVQATKRLGKQPDITIAIVEKKNGIDITLRCSKDSKLNAKNLLKFLSYNAGGKASASGVFIPQNDKKPRTIEKVQELIFEVSKRALEELA